MLFVIFNVLETGADTLSFRTMDTLCGFTGTVLSICVCLWLCNLRPTAFGSFSAYTFQIFLMGLFVQMVWPYACSTGVSAATPMWYMPCSSP